MRGSASASASAMSPFSSLPEGCIANIISLTSPKDAARAAAVSLGFKSAADSDIVWERFLPSDYMEKIADSTSPVLYSSKKELYFLLCEPTGLFLDGGKLNFRLSKSSGKKCYMICARLFDITWGSTPAYWNWTSSPDSRFGEVVELLSVCWLHISGRFPSEWFSANTNYAAYIVFKLLDDHFGLDLPVMVSVRCIGEGATEAGGTNNVRTASMVPLSEDERRAAITHRGRRPRPLGVVVAQTRQDGWMEVELGEFFVPKSHRFDVEFKLCEIQQLNWKRGLVVEGVEVRPKEGF